MAQRHGSSFAANADVGLDVGAVRQSSFKRVSVDVTVQPKSIAHPTDTKLLNRSREHLANLSRKEVLTLHQNYKRKGLQTVLKAGRYAHARQMNRMRKQVKCLRTFLGRIVKDVERKTNNMSEALNHKFGLAKQLIKQQRHDKNKL